MTAGLNFRLTLVCQDTDNDIGWTETYFGPIPGAPTPPNGWQQTVFNGLISWRNARLALMLSSSQIDFYKISDDGLAGDMWIADVGGPTKGTYTALTNNQGGPLDAALIRFDDATGQYHGRKFFHGFPVANFTGRQWTPSPTALAAMQAFDAATAVSGLCLRSKNKAAPPVPPTIYPAIARVEMVRLTGHRVGRPFDYLRGRRRIA